MAGEGRYSPSPHPCRYKNYLARNAIASALGGAAAHKAKIGWHQTDIAQKRYSNANLDACEKDVATMGRDFRPILAAIIFRENNYRAEDVAPGEGGQKMRKSKNNLRGFLVPYQGVGVFPAMA
jgi:hypothetical protein